MDFLQTTSKHGMNKKHSMGFEANVRQVERKRGDNTENLDLPPVKHVFDNSKRQVLIQ
jgi:hypothetical protein